VKTIRSFFWVIVLSFHVSSAGAHLLPILSGTLNVIEQNVYVVLSLPASAFWGLDKGPDGALDIDQYHWVEESLIAQTKQGLRVDGDGQTPELIELMTQVSPRDRKSPTDQDALVVMLEYRFAATPKTVLIKTNLFGDRASEQQLTIKAQKGEDIDTAVLTPLQDSHVLFQSPGSTLIRFMGTGVEHILFGWDHLIFLSTLLVSGRGLRQLLILLTAFTIAHSVTFFLATNGLVRFHPDLVELAIAGTIILSALKNILATPIPAAVFALLVFSCGLIHGLGFASSMNTIGLVGSRMVATLLGFNLGVEIGQVFFVLFWILCTRIYYRVGSIDPDGRASSVLSWFFLCAGIFWFYERALTAFGI
jgi:hydrogenase/urease accessory protein HupE